MKKRLLLGLILGTLQSLAAQESKGKGTTPTPISLASKAGAALDSNLLKGGGTDDTAVLQAVLDRAADGTPVHLLIDGPASVRGLNVYGNTTIECSAGGGLYLRDNSTRAIIRNAHRSRGAITDEHITVRGCFLNGNRERQPGPPIVRPDVKNSGDRPSNQEADRTYISGLQFLGVNDLTVEKLALLNVRAFGALIGNATRITIRDVSVSLDVWAGATDGLHFKGPIRFLSVDGVRLNVGDDGIAFNANDYETDDITARNDFGPYVGQGSITDVSVTNVQFIDTSLGFRFLSTKERIDRVTVSNVTGTVRGYLATISHWVNPTSFGNVGAIVINNVNVSRPLRDAEAIALWREGGELRKDEGISKEFNDGMVPLVSINGRMEYLSLRNLVTTLSDERPVLRIGPEGHVQMMTAELSLLDPTLQGVPLELDQGGHIERLNLSVLWKGSSADRGKNPIARLGGTVAQLNWVNTPPLYVDGALGDGNAIDVTFSQDVKAADFKAGVRIKVDGKLTGVARVHRPAGHADVVRYVLNKRVRPGDTLTWAYEAADGNIENWSGSQLLSVSEKGIR